MLKQAIEEYLLWMIEAGYGKETWRQAERILQSLHDFVQRHNIPLSSIFTHSTLSAFETEYDDILYAGQCVRGLWRYLFRNGVILEPPMKKRQLPDTYEEYLLYYGRRVLPGQVQHARKTLSALNDYLTEHHIPLSLIRISDLDDFLALDTAPFTPEVRRNKRGDLRGFLRYLYYENKILKKDIAPLLIGPPLYARVKPPKFLRPQEIQRLFDSSKPKNPWQLRAYAMLHLAYTLGLRSKEISLLTLDDICFGKGEVRFCDRKNTVPLTLPLPEDTIKAIAAYILGARPKTNHRTLFLSLQPPYGPICSAQVSRNISKLFRMANLPGSAYWLRHTYAQNLLERGASIFEIKEMLGHESIISAEKYLHVHTHLMREVLFDDETL
jgi:integrase/recombinase XerD